MPRPFSVLLGKTIRHAARLRGGSGSALPGLFVEKIDPPFIKRTLSELPYGVILVSGTNGKTTTTKLIVELLEGQGLRVFTNKTGSNFTRGVAAALLGDISLSGKLQADIAVLELDEAHAVHFVRAVAPTHTVLLNVMRDQLDRFGEIDTTAKLLTVVAQHTTKSLILNREDPRISAIADQDGVPKTIAYYGLDPSLRRHFPTDDSLYDTASDEPSTPQDASVVLRTLTDNGGTFDIDGVQYKTALAVTGAYNIFNTAAAISVVRAVLSDQLDIKKLLATLPTIQPAFGRGETINLDGYPLELILVKNPSGFRLGLSSFQPTGYATMIAINDNYADGRDMSWLWDVSFESLKHDGVATVSGIRAYDMAVRLQYDEIPFRNVDTNLSSALRAFIASNPHVPKRIYCTYTAMLHIRKSLKSRAPIKEIDS